MRLILVRHAHSEGNERKLIQGHAEYPLTERGRMQAEAVAERLADERIDRIYVSDLGRAIETAQPIIAAHPSATIAHDPRLRERAFGDYENRRRVDLIAEGLAPETNFWTAPPNGEHVDEFTRRIFSFLDFLWEAHRGETVLLVTHSGFIARLLIELAGEDESSYRRYKSSNAGISIIEFDLERTHTIRVMNDTSHLKRLGDATIEQMKK